MSGTDVDVAIIGGGPAGAAMAAYLAKEGVDCAVFERELFPRPHVGESLVPSSTRVFRELGFLDTMEAAGFPHKYGAVWTADGRDRAYTHEWEGLAAAPDATFAFSERPQTGVDMDYTYHVDRAKFDLLLLQHANQLGAAVYEGVHVRGVDRSDPDQARVEFNVGRKRTSVSAQVVIDASGRHTIVGTQEKWKVNDPVFDQYALHTWFQGYDRLAVAGDPSHTDYIYVHFLPISNSWVWQIPITDDVTSIGVVTQKARFREAGADRDVFFRDALHTREEFAEALRDAEQVRELKAEGDYSYSMRRIVDDRVVLIGDAARFVDPIFSTGVSIALNSARFASRDVLAGLESGDLSARAFTTYRDTIARGTRNWYEFISLYYRLNVLFTAFVRDQRYRLDVLKLLQGDVYDEDRPAVLDRMREVVTSVEQNPDHVWHQLLGDLTTDAFIPA